MISNLLNTVFGLPIYNTSGEENLLVPSFLNLLNSVLFFPEVVIHTLLSFLAQGRRLTMNETCADFGGQEHAGEKQFSLFLSAFVVSGSIALFISSILEKFCNFKS